MLIYLGFSSVAVFLATLALLRFGAPSSLAVAHLVFAVGVLPLIFGAITHFVPVLTRSGKAHRAVLLAPLALQLAGLLAFAFFSGIFGVGALHAAVGIALPLSLAFAGWLLLRARRTLGKPHPGWRWYLAALACLAVALAVVPVMQAWPEARAALRLLHLHLNTLGFIGLTALGTLQVLLPTVLSGPDPEAALRLRRDSWPAFGAVAAIAFGAAFWLPLALAGAALLLFVTLRIARAWLRRYGLPVLFGDGAAAALAAALSGFILLLVLGVLHAFRVVDGLPAVAAYSGIFLLPLITGALSQLLPVWRYPGVRSAPRDRMRAALVSGGKIRALLFVAGGVALACGIGEGLWLAGGGVLLFVLGLLRAVISSRAEPSQ